LVTVFVACKPSQQADGSQHVIAVKSPNMRKFIRALNAGDNVYVTYTEPVAVSVTRQCDSGNSTVGRSGGAEARRCQGGRPGHGLRSARAGQAKKLQRGGSFLCTYQYCSRYMVGTPGKGEVTTGTNGRTGLAPLIKGRTVVMIAHRLSTIDAANKIIVHKDGVVAEEGTNDELLARGGVYAELHRIEYQTPAEQAVTA